MQAADPEQNWPQSDSQDNSCNHLSFSIKTPKKCSHLHTGRGDQTTSQWRQSYDRNGFLQNRIGLSSAGTMSYLETYHEGSRHLKLWTWKHLLPQWSPWCPNPPSFFWSASLCVHRSQNEWLSHKCLYKPKKTCVRQSQTTASQNLSSAELYTNLHRRQSALYRTPSGHQEGRSGVYIGVPW